MTIDEIKAANEAAGYTFFGTKEMKAWGDTLASFKVIDNNGRVYIQRVKAARGYNGDRVPGTVGEVREFYPATGSIGPIEAGAK